MGQQISLSQPEWRFRQYSNQIDLDAIGQSDDDIAETCSMYFEVTSNYDPYDKCSKFEFLVEESDVIAINDSNMRPATGKQFRFLYLTPKGYKIMRSDYAKMLNARKYKLKNGDRVTIKLVDQMFKLYWDMIKRNIDKAIATETTRIKTLKANIVMLQKLKKTLA